MLKNFELIFNKLIIAKGTFLLFFYIFIIYLNAY